MSVVSLVGVNVLNNPARFTDKYEFEITFECMEPLEKGRQNLEWKLIYVGSATSNQYDQELDSLLVGPIPVGTNKFVFEADAPNTSRIPDAEILGVTVIILTCAYDSREFVRVGYYVNNEYESEDLNNDPPPKAIVEKIRRNILADKPRVTRFAIKWDSEASAPAEFPPEQPEADLAPVDEEEYGAEEQEDEETAEADPSAATLVDKDADMEGVQAAEPEADNDVADEDEMSEDGSVDIEAESEVEVEEEEGEGAADGDDMDVDMDKPEPSGQKACKSAEVMAH